MQSRWDFTLQQGSDPSLSAYKSGEIAAEMTSPEWPQTGDAGVKEGLRISA